MAYEYLLRLHFFPKRQIINDNTIEDLNKKQDKKQDKKQVIKRLDFLTINEVKISTIIRKIPYYYKNYIPVEDYELLKFGTFEETHIRHDEISLDNKYILMYYRNNKNNNLSLTDYLIASTSCKMFLFKNINSLNSIIDNLIQLEERSIRFFNINPENIVFDQGSHVPQFTNFKYSIQESRLSPVYISNIIDSIDDFTYQPLEIHLVFYLLKNTELVLDDSSSEQISRAFVNNMSIMKFFPLTYRESYAKECVSCIRKYNGVERKAIINDILERRSKWDIYGLSVIYIHIFCCLMNVFSLKGTIITKIIGLLSKNIHPDSNKRPSLKQFHNSYNELLGSEGSCWGFAKGLDNNKLSILLEKLAS